MKMLSGAEREIKVQEVIEMLRKHRNLGDSNGRPDLYGILEKVLKSTDPCIVNWTFLDALLVMFREEEEEEEEAGCSHGLRAAESKQMDFANVKWRLPCMISHGKDDHPLFPQSRFSEPWSLGHEDLASKYRQKRIPYPNDIESSPNYWPYKYRELVHGNCGAVTHGFNSCTKRSLKGGPKLTYKSLVRLSDDTAIVRFKFSGHLLQNIFNDPSNFADPLSMPENPFPDVDPNKKFDGSETSQA